MRCHIVTVKPDAQIIARRLAPTTADARTIREELMAQFDVRKKDVDIEQHEVPVAKADLLVYLNELYAALDDKPVEE